MTDGPRGCRSRYTGWKPTRYSWTKETSMRLGTLSTPPSRQSCSSTPATSTSSPTLPCPGSDRAATEADDQVVCSASCPRSPELGAPIGHSAVTTTPHWSSSTWTTRSGWPWRVLSTEGSLTQVFQGRRRVSTRGLRRSHAGLLAVEQKLGESPLRRNRRPVSWLPCRRRGTPCERSPSLCPSTGR